MGNTSFKKLWMGSLLLFTLASPIAFGMQLTLDGEYVVPAPRAELKPFTNYPVTNYRVDVKMNGPEKSTMEFDIPLDLTGPARRGSEIPHKVRLVERDDSTDQMKIFEGEKAITTCMSSWDNLQCVVNFKNLNLNKNETRKFLDTRYSGKELQAKIELADQFGTEPIGFFSLKECESISINGEPYCIDSL